MEENVPGVFCVRSNSTKQSGILFKIMNRITLKCVILYILNFELRKIIDSYRLEKVLVLK